MDIIHKCYVVEKLTYQPMILGFTKMLVFHILGSCLGYTIIEGMVLSILTIVNLNKTFPSSIQ
jgi:hypothetical protein